MLVKSNKKTKNSYDWWKQMVSLPSMLNTTLFCTISSHPNWIREIQITIRTTQFAQKKKKKKKKETFVDYGYLHKLCSTWVLHIVVLIRGNTGIYIALVGLHPEVFIITLQWSPTKTNTCVSQSYLLDMMETIILLCSNI